MPKAVSNRSQSLLFVWVATLMASFFNWLYNIALNRLLPLDEFSQVGALLNTVLIFAGVALACQYAATKFTPESERHSRTAMEHSINTHLSLGLIFGLFVTVFLWLFEPQWSQFLFLTTPTWVNYVLAFTPTMLLFLSMLRGVLFGWPTYYLAGILLIIESLIKLFVLIYGYLTTQTFSFSLTPPVPRG